MARMRPHRPRPDLSPNLAFPRAVAARRGVLMLTPITDSLTYSITWSDRPSTDGGIVSPSALAVLRLMTNSNFVGCSTGRSAGFAPLRVVSPQNGGRPREALK